MDPSSATLPGRTAGLEVAGVTDPGRVRNVNEDAWACHAIDGATVLVVADGMGGHQAGEVASALAVETLLQTYRETDGPPPKRLTRAFQRANSAVHDQSMHRADARGMGTTLTAAVVDGPNLIVGHAGDSRAYLWREGRLTLLTRDHSWVGERVRDGVLSEEEARRHRWRSVITNALGSFPQARLDLFGIELQPGDEVLLCSDGLNSVLTDEALEDLLSRVSSEPAERVAKELVQAANAGGGPDNITVALLRYRGTDRTLRPYSLPTLDDSPHPRTLEPEPEARTTQVLEPAARRPRISWLMPALMVVGFLAVALLLAYLLAR
jgi:serine/threonine protein phosphatase PrpC